MFNLFVRYFRVQNSRLLRLSFCSSNLITKQQSYNNFTTLPAQKFTKNHNNNNFSRHLSSSKEENDNDDLENEIDVLEEIDPESFEWDLLISPKNLLYTNNSGDKTIIDINKCNTQDELFEQIKNIKNDFKLHHLVQSILVLWEIRRCIEKEIYLSNKDNIKNYQKETIKNNENPEFIWLLNELTKNASQLTPDELTCCLLYLNKIGLNIKDSFMQTLINECCKRISDDKEIFSLSALSRYVVAINSIQNGYYLCLVCKDCIPRIINFLNNCNNSEDIRLITISFNHLHKLITNNILVKYKEKVEILLDEKKINSETVRCILKIVNFLNYPQWSQESTILIRKLILILKENIPKFQTRELVAMFKVFQSHLEPAELVEATTKQSQKLLAESPCAELLSCAVLYSLPDKRKEMTEIAKNIVFSSEIPSIRQLPALFKVLRLLKISNLSLCNAYWTKVLYEIENNLEEQESYRIARYCHRYMHFNNNLGGTYRHYEFEKYVTNLILKEIQNGLSNVIPARFAKLSSFVIAYGHTQKGKLMFPDFIIEKLELMSIQFTVIDCLHISRGLQIALEMRFKHFVPKDLAIQLSKIENILNNCADRHLMNENLSLVDLNCIIRTFNNRKSQRKSYLFQKIITKYQNINSPLNSRLVRDITFNLNASGYRMENVFEKLLNYIDENKDFIIGDTVEKVLYCCYNLGYIPENENILNSSIEIIQRDFNYMNGLSIIQACLALSYFKVLPHELINRVFNIEFIQRLEDEIQMCYSKATYPERVLNQVMQLNRSVCLDYPETKVPWFQQNYIEAQLSKQPKIETQFHIDVKRLLNLILIEKDLIKCNTVTPYGHCIDFVLQCDKNNNYIKPTNNLTNNQMDVSSIAILLPKLESFCENNTTYFRGQEYLKQRHLEMLGYKVKYINYIEWNSMYMNVENAKINYLKSLLHIT